jgi:hypothetical protein
MKQFPHAMIILNAVTVKKVQELLYFVLMLGLYLMVVGSKFKTGCFHGSRQESTSQRLTHTILKTRREIFTQILDM